MGAEFDSQHAEDDEHDPADHDRGERFTVDQGGQDRGEGDAGGSPDAVGDAERHALAQDEREEHERAEETGDHERIPARMTERGFEGERPGDLTEDRAGEEYPLLHHSTFERSWVGPRPLTGTQTIQATYQMV